MTLRDRLGSLFRRELTLRQKLVAVCLMFALPIGLLLYLLLARQTSELVGAQKAQASTLYLKTCHSLLDHLTQHRQALRRLLGRHHPDDEIKKQAAAVDADLKALEPISSANTRQGEVASLRKKWQRIANRGRQTTLAENEAWHQEMIDEVQGLVNQVLDDTATQIGTSADITFQRLLWNKNFILAGVTASVALTLVLVWAMLRNLTRQMNAITRLFKEIRQGNFRARTPVYIADDELGRFAVSLNAMLDNLTSLMQSREERNQIQASITKLLEEISGVAEGDLTKEAEVTSDITGAIADSFNVMIEQLRRVISSVQEATLQVSHASNQIQAAAEELVQGSEGQARQILGASGNVRKITESIRQVAENASTLAQVASQALASTAKAALPSTTPSRG